MASSMNENFSQKKSVDKDTRGKCKGNIMSDVEIANDKPKLRYPKGLISYRQLTKHAGRPPTLLDANKLYELAQTLLPDEVIASIMNFDCETLVTKYSEILQAGRNDRKHTLSQRMWHKAIVEGDTKMLIWLSKQHLGYKEQWPDMQQNQQINIFTSDIPK